MPAPAAAVYVIAIVGGCAAAYAFKEVRSPYYFYDEHTMAYARWLVVGI
jgi:hypothetical protein